MAYKNTSCLSPKKSRYARPKGPYGELEGSALPEVRGSPPFFEGHNWSSKASPADLCSLRGPTAFHIPWFWRLLNLILGPSIQKVSLRRWPSFLRCLRMGCSCLFACPFVVLDYLLLAPTQLHSNAWWILVSCCMISRMTLGVGREEYPDLTAREFLFTHGVLRLEGNLCSFQARGKKKIAHLESHFSHIKYWTRRFFFVSGLDWEFPESEATHQELPVRDV